ncbi:hypothetical protein QE410_001783 [Microbacterium sp. SORGH_AS 1204]|uniref:hypothetical protein n=1 Tax=Microbacterium sp. SORGH_AS_1204 TaxID=3041785 RepID=UPI002791739D|nr:hypothetical protein [Microbacterium sp. SORGH_AS_1204]MDQ1136984.1 hypothetical protein [Microbacterium sp. SORGH_AS_1204]
MPDPRALRIDVGPFHLAPTPEATTWTAAPRSAPGGRAPVAGGSETSPPEITAAWNDWVVFAQKVLRADELWRASEARGDAWDEGFAAARDAAAVNPYR